MASKKFRDREEEFGDRSNVGEEFGDRSNVGKEFGRQVKCVIGLILHPTCSLAFC
jgi:hypothetical protein